MGTHTCLSEDRPLSSEIEKLSASLASRYNEQKTKILG